MSCGCETGKESLSVLVFDEVLNNTTAKYTSPEWTKLLGGTERLSLQVVVSMIRREAGASNPAVTVAVEASGNERDWSPFYEPGSTEFDTTGTSTFQVSVSDSYVHSEFPVRLSVAGSTGNVMRVKVFATARDADGTVTNSVTQRKPGVLVRHILRGGVSSSGRRSSPGPQSGGGMSSNNKGSMMIGNPDVKRGVRNSPYNQHVRVVGNPEDRDMRLIGDPDIRQSHPYYVGNPEDKSSLFVGNPEDRVRQTLGLKPTASTTLSPGSNPNRLRSGRLSVGNPNEKSKFASTRHSNQNPFANPENWMKEEIEVTVHGTKSDWDSPGQSYGGVPTSPGGGNPPGEGGGDGGPGGGGGEGDNDDPDYGSGTTSCPQDCNTANAKCNGCFNDAKSAAFLCSYNCSKYKFSPTRLLCRASCADKWATDEAICGLSSDCLKGTACLFDPDC